jgi:hypothetical protein
LELGRRRGILDIRSRSCTTATYSSIPIDLATIVSTNSTSNSATASLRLVVRIVYFGHCPFSRIASPDTSAPCAPGPILPYTQWLPAAAQYNTPSRQGKTLINSPTNKKHGSTRPYVSLDLLRTHCGQVKRANIFFLPSLTSSTPTKTACSPTKNSASCSAPSASSCPSPRRTTC